MRTDIITNACTDMASEGSSSAEIAQDVLISMDRSDDSSETSPPSPQDVSQEPIPSTPYDEGPPVPSDYIARVEPHHAGLDLQSARQRAIRLWHGPRHPEHAASARRLRSFNYHKWSPEGKPSADSLANAGFYNDGRSQILNFVGLLSKSGPPLYITFL